MNKGGVSTSGRRRPTDTPVIRTTHVDPDEQLHSQQQLPQQAGDLPRKATQGARVLHSLSSPAIGIVDNHPSKSRINNHVTPPPPQPPFSVWCPPHSPIESLVRTEPQEYLHMAQSCT